MTKKVFALVLVAGFIFGGCAKDEIDDVSNLVSGSFNGKVTAKVENSSAVHSLVNVVLAVNDAGFKGSEFNCNTFDGAGSVYSNAGFTITLPTSGLSSYLKDVTDYFEDFMAQGEKGKLKISNPSARILDVDFFAFYYDEDEDEAYVAGWFFYATSAQRNTVCMFVYVDSDLTVTAGSAVTVSLKKGWNRMYLVGNTLTTKAPDGLKWYYEEF
jgi:hypothetical protein